MNSGRRETAWLLLGMWPWTGLAILVCGGCYDGDRLVEMARDEAIRSQLEEIDLGTYCTTLPRDSQTAVITEIEFRIFGNAPHYRAVEIVKQLESDEYRLRYTVLTAVRQAAREEFAEPDLTTLKQRLKVVANGVLEDAPLTSIGFAQLRFVNR